MVAVIDALEGPIALTECGSGSCDRESQLPGARAVAAHQPRRAQVARGRAPFGPDRTHARGVRAASRSATRPRPSRLNDPMTTKPRTACRPRLRVRLHHRHREDIVEPGLNENVIRFISEKKDEPEWMTRVAARGLPPLAEDGRAPPLGEASHYPPIDYQAIRYYAAPEEAAEARQPRRSRSRAAPHLREARHLARRAEAARRAWRSTPSSTRSRWPPPTRRNSRSTASSSARSPKPCTSAPT